jgi:hypothetical protein
VPHDGSGEAVAAVPGRLQIGTGKSRRQIGRGEAVSGGRGVDDVLDRRRRHRQLPPAVKDAHPRLGQLEHDLRVGIYGESPPAEQLVVNGVSPLATMRVLSCGVPAGGLTPFKHLVEILG